MPFILLRVLGAMLNSVPVATSNAFPLVEGATETKKTRPDAYRNLNRGGLTDFQAHACASEDPYVDLLPNERNPDLRQKSALHMCRMQLLRRVEPHVMNFVSLLVT